MKSKQNQPERVTISKTSYDKKSDTVSWEAKLADGKLVELVWTRMDFGPTFGMDVLMTEKDVEKFNKMMLNKEVNLVIGKKTDVDGL